MRSSLTKPQHQKPALSSHTNKNSAQPSSPKHLSQTQQSITHAQLFPSSVSSSPKDPAPKATCCCLFSSVPSQNSFGSTLTNTQQSASLLHLSKQQQQPHFFSAKTRRPSFSSAFSPKANTQEQLHASAYFSNSSLKNQLSITDLGSSHTPHEPAALFLSQSLTNPAALSSQHTRTPSSQQPLSSQHSFTALGSFPRSPLCLLLKNSLLLQDEQRTHFNSVLRLQLGLGLLLLKQQRFHLQSRV